MASFTMKQRKLIAKKIRENAAKFHMNGDGRRHLAKELNVSPSTVSNWMHEKQTPSIEHLYQMSKLFDIPLRQLCGLPKTTSKRTSDLASDIIIKIASCKNRSGKTLFHSIPMGDVQFTIRLIFNELHEAEQFQSKVRKG